MDKTHKILETLFNGVELVNNLIKVIIAGLLGYLILSAPTALIYFTLDTIGVPQIYVIISSVIVACIALSLFVYVVRFKIPVDNDN